MEMYRCKCVEGPARDCEFDDIGPPVVVDVVHQGRILPYRLVRVLNRECTYRFGGYPRDSVARRVAPRNPL